MKLTPGQVKNTMRRGLRCLVDPEPEPDAKQKVRSYFNSRCAYCDIPLAEGTGDIDHLISAALGGANGLANRVLSCRPCNGNEKREGDWIEFLGLKNPQQELFSQRHKKILDWVNLNGGHPELDPKLAEIIAEEAKRTTEIYDLACSRIKNARKG